MLKKTQLTMSSLSAESALLKLSRENIPVYSAYKSRKNQITFTVATKDLEKVFAILPAVCYNVNKVRHRGLSLLYQKCLQGVGLIVGAALFCATVAFAESRVLKIEVVGSGAYYQEEIVSVLKTGGVKPFSPKPKDTAMLSAEILSFPNVNYCAISCSGGILTVEVRVGEEHELLSSAPLYAPVSGLVEELLLVRGTARVAVGDSVEQGQLLVENTATYGEVQRKVLVIAQVKLSFSVKEFFSGTEEEALASAYLKYGEISCISAEQAEGGFLITGTAFCDVAMNME